MKALLGCMLLAGVLGLVWATGDGAYVLLQIILLGVASLVSAFVLSFFLMCLSQLFRINFRFGKALTYIAVLCFFFLFSQHWLRKVEIATRKHYPIAVRLKSWNASASRHGVTYLPDLGWYASEVSAVVTAKTFPED